MTGVNTVSTHVILIIISLLQVVINIINSVKRNIHKKIDPDILKKTVPMLSFAFISRHLSSPYISRDDNLSFLYIFVDFLIIFSLLATKL